MSVNTKPCLLPLGVPQTAKSSPTPFHYCAQPTGQSPPLWYNLARQGRPVCRNHPKNQRVMAGQDPQGQLPNYKPRVTGWDPRRVLIVPGTAPTEKGTL